MKFKEWLKKIFPLTISKFQFALKNQEKEFKSIFEVALNSQKEEVKSIGEKYDKTMAELNGSYRDIALTLRRMQNDLSDFKRNAAMNLDVQNRVIHQSVEVAKREETLILAMSEKLSKLEISNNSNLNKIERNIEEVLWADIFNNAREGVNWIYKTSLWPGRGAVGYPYLYVLFRILDSVKPRNILDIGLGISSKVIAGYVKEKDASHVIIEHDEKWIDFFQQEFDLPSNSTIKHSKLVKTTWNNCEDIFAYESFSLGLQNQKFDLISIDGPFGYNNREYSRVDILSILPDALSDSFIILIDDYDRVGEQNTVKEIEKCLNENGIDHLSGKYTGQKDLCIIMSPDLKFLKTL